MKKTKANKSRATVPLRALADVSPARTPDSAQILTVFHHTNFYRHARKIYLAMRMPSESFLHL
jgi:hypothetical protein